MHAHAHMHEVEVRYAVSRSDLEAEVPTQCLKNVSTSEGSAVLAAGETWKSVSPR